MARIIKDKGMKNRKYLRQFTISFIFNEMNNKSYCRYTRRDVKGKRIDLSIISKLHTMKATYPNYVFEPEYQINYDHKSMSLFIYIDYYNTKNDSANMKKIIWKLI